jgi:hypothetical protein
MSDYNIGPPFWKFQIFPLIKSETWMGTKQKKRLTGFNGNEQKKLFHWSQENWRENKFLN